MFHFVGVPLQQLMMVGGIAGGLIVVFYILKLKRRPVAVPFSKIWDRILRDKQATSLFSQLKRLLSLLLQLAVLALLLLALGDPRTAVSATEGRNVVVLIDTSASMQATDVQPSRLAAGVDKLTSVVRGLGASDRMMIAQMDSTITPLSTMTNDIPELEKALGAVRPSDTRADFARALRFAADTLRGLSAPEIIVVSDGSLAPPIDAQGPVELGDVKLTYVHVGERSRNAAITSFSVRRYPLDKSRYEAMAEVTNTGEEDLDLELRLYGDEVQTHLFRFKLRAGQKDSRFLTNLSGASHRLRAEISLATDQLDEGGRPLRVHDDLPADDSAYALMPERRRARIQVVTAGDNTYLEAALLLDEYLDVTTLEPSKYPGEGVFDVTIFDSVAPPLAPGTDHVLYLNPSGKDVPFTVDKEITSDDEGLGFDEVEAEHPIVRHTQLTTINIGRAHILKGNKEDKVIGASFKGPILIAGRRAGFKFVALGFDIRESDLPLRVSWPLLLLNTINDFVEEDASYISSFQTGTVWRVPAPSTLSEVELVRNQLPPEGAPPEEKEREVDPRLVPIEEGRAVYFGERAGFYTLRAKTGPGGDAADEPFKTEFAANLADPIESNIKPQPKLVVGDKEGGEIEGFTIGVRNEIWAYLLLAVIAISAIEWLTYHRRITV
ncbi:MAG: VWA domain-containing protein [Polyangiaceae bacterium]|nr:VWA domain-containing protein [Polyangiaceae bacterium]